MPGENQSTRYYLFSLSNLLAAFGGGTILGKGIGIINNTFLQGGSILSFFVGTIFGLIFLQFIPKKWSKTIACSFSICGGLTSIILLSVFEANAINGRLSDTPALWFFILLCTRFGFWFYSRVLRASAAAGQQQRIAWVELGYYLGVIFGLIIWELFGINIGMAAALLLDAILQFSAGSLDWVANRLVLFSQNDGIAESQISQLHNDKKTNNDEKVWCWRLAIAAVFLTIAVQVVIFNLAHQVLGSFSPYILAFFYFGVAVAAIVYKRFKIKLDWNVLAKKNSSYAVICSTIAQKNKKISFFAGSFLSLFSVAIVIVGIIDWRWGMISPVETSGTLLLTFVSIAAFFYEILTLAILDRIGLEEKAYHHQNMIVVTYGLMGVGAAVSFWILGTMKNSLLELLFTLVVCFMFSVLMIQKRLI
ncbi:MAG: hypothetical protein EPO11_02340 [Gammaproteobacteria bacterium]|nr:MAG: hypothetical protein EPO11_02340 [Gammaproteobacteria bacterium]